MPRRKKPPPIDQETEPGSGFRVYDVHLHRIIEQTAVIQYSARSRDEAEAAIQRKLEDNDPALFGAVVWKDGELETTESIVYVAEAAAGTGVEADS